MKKLLSIILAITMIATLIPSVSASESEVITYNFLSTAVSGNQTTQSSKNATYEITEKNGSAPWAYVNAIADNNNNSYSYEKCYNWYGTETFKEPEQGDGGYVFKIKVKDSGYYSTILKHIAQKTSVNAKIFLVPVSSGIDFSGTETLSQNIKGLSDEYYLGYVESYAANRTVKETSLKYRYIAAGEYYLVFAPHGVDENYKPSENVETREGNNKGKYLYVFSVYSFVLDPSAPSKIEVSIPVEAMNTGDKIQAEVKVTVGDNVFTNSDAVTLTSENGYATVDTMGKITGVSEGVAKIKATVGNVESEAVSIAIVNPNKAAYEYVMGGRVLNTVPDTTASGTKVDFPTNLYNVEPAASVPWRTVRAEATNSYQLYYAKTADTSYYGVVNSSVVSGNVNKALFVYSIYVPKSGTYNLTVNSVKNNDYGKAKIYFAKYDDAILSTTVPSETGPIKASDLVADMNISDENNVNKTVGEVVVPTAGEYLLVIAPSDANGKGKPFYNYKGFKLTRVADNKDIADAFKTETPVTTQYSPTVSGTGYNTSEGSSSVEGITETLQADGSYKMYAPEKNGDANFLYWAKGLSVNKKIVSYENEFYYTPAGGDNNILIAVYDNADSSANKAEFYNANGQLIKLITNTSEDNKVPALPAMAGYNTASAWKQYNGEKEVTVGNDITPEGTMIFVAQYELEEPAEVTVTVKDGNGTATVAYGEEVTCTPDASKGTFKWWKKTVNGTSEIVSIDETYKFLAWENCTVTAEYDTKKPVYTGNKMKIIIDSFEVGDTENGVMAEFIGFDDNTVEKGIMIGTNKIAMTRPGNQFTVTGEPGDTFKGYAIVKNGTTYNLIVDGEVTLTNAE